MLICFFYHIHHVPWLRTMWGSSCLIDKSLLIVYHRWLYSWEWWPTVIINSVANSDCIGNRRALKCDNQQRSCDDHLALVIGGCNNYNNVVMCGGYHNIIAWGDCNSVTATAMLLRHLLAMVGINWTPQVTIPNDYATKSWEQSCHHRRDTWWHGAKRQRPMRKLWSMLTQLIVRTTLSSS